jgi:hypothetical protein
MAGTLTFCPYCGARITVSGQRFCGSCGKSFGGEGSPDPAATRTPAAAPDRPMGASAPVAPVPTAPTVASARPAGWPEAASWASVGDAVRLAIPPVLIWLAATLLVTVLLSDLARQQAYSGFGSSNLGYLGAGTLDSFLSAGAGVIGALFAGLGFQVGANGSAGALGTTNVGAAVSLSLLPLVLLALYAVAIGRAARTAARRRGGTTLAEYAGPALLGAAFGAAAMYVGALLLSTSLGGALNSIGGSSSASIAVQGGPTFGGLLFVLFPILAAGALTGALAGGGWSFLMARLEPQLAQPSIARVVVRLPLLAYGLAGYLVALVIGSVLAIVVVVALSLTNGADIVQLARLLPAIVLLMPNAIAILVLAGTGTQMGLAATGVAAGSVPVSTGSLWSLPIEWVLAGLAIVLLPGLIAGVVTRARMPAATPGLVAVVGALTGLVALVAAVLAVPSFAAQGQVFASDANASTKLYFDLGQAILVGAIAMVGTALVGYRYGGSAATRVPDVPGLVAGGGGAQAR